MSHITQRPIPANVTFFSSDDRIEVLRLSRDGIWANPDVPADEAAQVVLNAIEANIKVLVQRAVEDEREACAKMCDEALLQLNGTANQLEESEYLEQCVVQGAMTQAVKLAKAIRARGEK